MKHLNVIGITAAILFAGLWAYPLARAIAGFREAQDYFRETWGSINASNDVDFSFWLLAGYLFSLTAAFAFALLLSVRSRPWMILPAALFVIVAGEVLWLRPEGPIVFFPVMNPWHPVVISGFALAITAQIFYPSRPGRQG